MRKWSLGSWAYEWNANGSLHKIKRADGKVFTFKYDAFGRRISKSYHRREFLYIWDKNVPLHEIQKEELCEDNIITWIFDGFTPTAKLINGKAYSIISDHIGTPLMAIDTQGNKVWERELDIYGKVRKEFTSDDVKDRRSGFMPFLYAGQYYDKETELAYNRFRYYSPETGSYISQDPIGLLGNNPNFYAYVKDTNTWVDIFALDVYKLIAETDGWYPVFERGKTQPTSYQWLKKDDVYKIGETQDFSKRYDPKDLNKGIINNSNAGAFVNGESIGLKPIFASTGGTKSADLMLEKQLLIDQSILTESCPQEIKFVNN